MNRKLTLAGTTGLVFFLGCGGSAHKLGGDTQANESAGGSAGSSETGGVAGNMGQVGGQGGDPFGGVVDAGYAGGQVGGSVGAGGAVAVGGAPPTPASGGTAGAVGGSHAYGGSVGAGGQSQPQPAGPQGNPGIFGSGGAANQDFVGTWSGYVEQQHFASGSDALLMTIDNVSDTELSGHIVMGQGPGTVPDPHTFAGQGGSPGYEPIEGFSYTPRNGKTTGQRLEFDIALNEVWESTCAGLAPVPGTYSCLPPTSYAYGAEGGRCYTIDASGVQQDFDCTLLALCNGGVCKCDDTHCFADMAMYVAHFDATLRSPYLDGSAAGIVFSPNNVHFTKQ